MPVGCLALIVEGYLVFVAAAAAACVVVEGSEVPSHQAQWPASSIPLSGPCTALSAHRGHGDPFHGPLTRACHGTLPGPAPGCHG